LLQHFRFQHIQVRVKISPLSVLMVIGTACLYMRGVTEEAISVLFLLCEINCCSKQGIFYISKFRLS
jgi:hypothetical protein